MPDEITLGRLYSTAIRCLPPDWSIAIQFRQGECKISLKDVGGFGISVHPDPANLAERFLDLINHARSEEGMTVVNIKGGSSDGS